jgi:hypothetical protein
LQQGCYKYAIDAIGIPNLAALPKSERENKTQVYEERLSMLSLAAIRDSEGKFDLHYRLYKSYPICRAAYMYFFAIPNTTLNTAETNFSECKEKYGHVNRRARSTKKDDTAKDEAESWIGNRVELFAEDQPNAHGLVNGDAEDDDDCGFVTVAVGTGAERKWQVIKDTEHTDRTKQSKWTLPKWRANKHMDPIVIKVVVVVVVLHCIALRVSG